MKLVPFDETTFVLKPYAAPLEKEIAKILTNKQLSSDIKVQLYQQALERAKGLQIPKKKYVQIERPEVKEISVENSQFLPPPEENISQIQSPLQIQSPVQGEVSTDISDRHLLIDIYQMLKNTPTVLSAAIHEASRMALGAFQDQQQHQKSSSRSNISKSDISKNYTLTPTQSSPEEETPETVKQKKLKSPLQKTPKRKEVKAKRTLPFQATSTPQAESIFSEDDKELLEDFQHLEQPDSIFHVDMPSILRSKRNIPRTYMPLVQDLYRKLKYNIPLLNFAVNSGQIIVHERPIPGGYIIPILLDMVRDTATFRENPDYSGVHEIIDMMRDHNFPPDEIRNLTFRKKYINALRGKEEHRDQTVFAFEPLSPISKKNEKKKQIQKFKQSIGVLPPATKKRKAAWEEVK